MALTKEKIQKTVRIDTQLLNEVQKALEAGVFPEGTQFIDIVERGIHLANNEMRHWLSAWELEVRVAVSNMTKDQQRLVRGLLVAMVERQVDPRPRIDPEEKFWEFIQSYLRYCNTVPEASACIEYYKNNYGKKKK